MTSTTPRGSDTISAEEGYVVIEVFAWKINVALVK